MTTIVYHKGVIAADSRTSAEYTITNDDTDKIRKVEGVFFAFTGNCSDEPDLISAYFGRDYNKDSNVGAFIYDGNRVYISGIGQNSAFWKTDISDKSYAIGSGSDHAWTAVDMGCSAIEAVKMAMKRDVSTGGKVKTLKVVIK